MSKITTMYLLKRCMASNIFRINITAYRGVLSEAYLCEEAWQKRLESPLLKQIRMDQYFVETDKKFGSKRLVSGVDIDLFANNLQDESQLDELEHLLYRFRRTKRSTEMMDSTNYAVIRAFLKFRHYESLFRILKDRDSYGVFPDLYSYNILMSTFLQEKMYLEATHVAILMMLQEDFRNSISVVLGVYSCQMFLNECSLNSLSAEEVEIVEDENENKKDDDDEEEETLVRVPFLRNECFDDHFDITEPKHLIGKIFYLLGCQMDDSLGRSYQIIGLAMYDKWEKAAALLHSFSDSKGPCLLSEAIEKVMSLIDAIPDDEGKTKEKRLNDFNVLFQKMKSEGKILDGDLMASINANLKEVLQLQKDDIAAQKKMYTEWENERELALNREAYELDKDRRLKVIEEKKEYLFWKEKSLFFFENEDKNLEELKNVKEIIAARKQDIRIEDTYVPPEIVKKLKTRLSKYQTMAKVKRL